MRESIRNPYTTGNVTNVTLADGTVVPRATPS